MAARQPEVIRQLDDGFVVAWDTKDISEEVRSSLRKVVDGQADLLSRGLATTGRTGIVTAPAAPVSPRRRVA
jgi:hypothetical protein